MAQQAQPNSKQLLFTFSEYISYSKILLLLSLNTWGLALLLFLFETGFAQGEVESALGLSSNLFPLYMGSFVSF